MTLRSGRIARYTPQAGQAARRSRHHPPQGQDRSSVTKRKAFLSRSSGRLIPSLAAHASSARAPSRPRTLKDVPARTPESDALAKALAKEGFKFVARPSATPFMQPGLVDDHVVGVTAARSGN